MGNLPEFSLKKFYWKDYMIIFLGTFMYALGVTQFMPHQFVMGGLTGLAVLLNYAFSLPVSIMVFLMNGLLLLMAFRLLGSGSW